MPRPVVAHRGQREGGGGGGGADREAYMQTNTHVYQDFRGSSMMLRHV